MSILSAIETGLEKVAVAVKTATTVLPAVTELVKHVEAASSAPGNGTAKKEAVLGVVQAALATIPDDVKALIGGDKMISFISSVIDVVVKFFNATGLFTKST